MLKRLLTILILCLISLTLIGSTYAGSVGYFSDTENSNPNSLTTTSLDFSLRDTSDIVLSSPLFNVSAMVPGNSETKTIRIKKDGLADFKYNLSAVQVGGDVGLCTALQVEASSESLVQYTGSLLGLTLSSVPTISGGQDDWTFKVSLNDGSGALQNKTCLFDLKIRGWQTDSNGTWGFGDEETLTNSVTSGSWDISGSVVINELMWMGSVNSEHLADDEWIELRNITGSPIDLTGWKIDGAGSGSSSITLAGTIPASGFFLVSHYGSDHSAINDLISIDQTIPGLSLANDGEQLTLKSNLNVTIDQTAGGAWATGINGTEKQSMERNDDPTTGWHTCIAVACHSTTYWDADGHNWGTSKAFNLSENDPSSPAYVAPAAPVEVATVEPIPTASPSATIIESTPLPEVIIVPVSSATPSGEILP